MLAFAGTTAGGAHLNMTAELWRNQAFQEAIGQKVPRPTNTFATAYNQAKANYKKAH